MKLVFASALALAAVAYAAPNEVRGCKKQPLKKGCPCTIEAFKGCPNWVEPSTEAPTTKATTKKTTTLPIKPSTEEPEKSTEASTTKALEVTTKKDEAPKTTPTSPMSSTQKPGHKGDDHEYKPERKPENIHNGWATDDILKVLTKLNEMRRDGDEEDLGGNYFVGGDLVVNNGLINNEIAAVGNASGGRRMDDVPTLEFNRFMYCMVGKEKAMALMSKDEAMLQSGDNYQWDLSEVVATVTIGKMHEIYECMGHQWMQQTGHHLETPHHMDMMKDEMKKKVEDHMKEHYNKDE